MSLMAPPASLGNISPAAWVILGILVVFILVLNFWMISVLRNKDDPENQVLRRFMHSVNHPDRSQDQQMSELRNKVEQFKNQKPE